VATAQTNIPLVKNSTKAVVLSGTGGSVLNYTIVRAPRNGTVKGSGKNWSYTPVANYVGKDSFAFTVSVGCMASVPATVSFNVTQTLTAFASQSLSEIAEDKILVLRQSLYPDPVLVTCTVVVPEAFERVATTVYDITGSALLINRHRKSGANQLTLDASSLRPGQYILRVQTDKGSYSFRFVKQ
jgi:hypothetical protein